MKQLILGNEAVARGLYEAGCSFVSSYPGTPSTEITEAVAKYPEVYAEWAPNEKVAMEAAFGASLAGRRSISAAARAFRSCRWDSGEPCRRRPSWDVCTGAGTGRTR